MKSKGIIILVVYFLLSSDVKGQNLVYNGYFEIYNNCQNGSIINAVGWNASSETPDYYNICMSDVPNTDIGYQQDCCGGGGYAGGFMFDKNDPNNGDRDYISTKLIDTLKAGHKYIAKMYVNRADAIDYAVATIGMLFTDTITTLPTGQGFISANPQVKSKMLLSDTLNWILIQDTITAIGNEVYLTIGNFNADAMSDTVKLTNYWPSFPIAYYYIDGVSVTEIQTTDIKQVVGSNAQIMVYPNPVAKSFQVSLAGNSVIKEITLVDVLGNEVFPPLGGMKGGVTPTPNPSKEVKITIDVSNLSNGVYFINLKTNEGLITKKLVVQR